MVVTYFNTLSQRMVRQVEIHQEFETGISDTAPCDATWCT